MKNQMKNQIKTQIKTRQNRKLDQLRPIEIIEDYTKYADASVLFKQGDTWVLCQATIEKQVPRFLRGSGKGWITAEYDMLPTATHSRNNRSSQTGRISGRSQEIQRLIGRSLRAGVALNKIGEITIKVDCDVLQADGGTRTTSINGGWVALCLALKKHFGDSYNDFIIHKHITAISVGIIDNTPILDLNYSEDSSADTDMNIVAGDNNFVEIQGSAEGATFSKTELDAMLELADIGIKQIQQLQKQYL